MIRYYKFKKEHMTWGRYFILVVFFILPLSCTRNATTTQETKKILLLGFDGMDPVLLEKYMNEGILPNFKLLKERGDFKPLITSMPPQSPVAWSNFITGMNPGGHGIFDFIARDPQTYIPYLSTSKTIESKRHLNIGNWKIPFSKSETLLLRKGRSFWEILEAKGIPSTIIKVPANFPPVESEAKTLSDMGTPDILGTYGTFTFYTTKELDNNDEVVSGRVIRVKYNNYSIKTELKGPPNPLKTKRQEMSLKLSVDVDPESPVALIRIQDHEIILKSGEWSDWIKVEFKIAPFQILSGICRLYLRSIHPEFELYVSPINIDPHKPNIPISTPTVYSAEIADEIGYFYTQGMPEDTKALDQDFLNNDDFLNQSDYILEERIKMLNMELNRFNSGLLFVYFSTTDPIQHMFWKYIDKEHPAYNPEDAATYSNVIRETYEKMDTVLSKVIKNIDNHTTLIVLSDHGFGSFHRYFNMNTWLKENGYISFINHDLDESGEFFENVDFHRTKAYALGFNGIYINLRGREGMGIVSEGEEKEELTKDLIRKLENVRDSENGKIIIMKVYRREEIYSGKYVKDAPDLIVGYNRGYRASWETALGKVPKELIGNNMKSWSGDHCMDPKLVPGVILSNRKLKEDAPHLYDIAPTILSEFSIEIDKDMVGKPIF